MRSQQIFKPFFFFFLNKGQIGLVGFLLTLMSLFLARNLDMVPGGVAAVCHHEIETQHPKMAEDILRPWYQPWAAYL